MGMSTSRTSPAEIFRAMIPARFELGIRDAKATTDSLLVKIGFAHASAWVEVRHNAADLYDVEIFKVRGCKRTTLATANDVFVGDLARRLVNEWCQVCAEKGW